MKFRYIIILVCSFFIFMPTWAQKKEISAARDQIKSEKDLNKAQQSMEKLLKDSTNRQDPKIWLTLLEAVTKQYEQGNETLYLKQKYDTAQLFNFASQLFSICESFDSVDAAPDKKGKIKPEYRHKHAEMLNRIRPNLYTAGIFNIRKQKYEEAYDYFNTYIGCASQPLFRDYHYEQNDKRLPQAAYWAVYCGYKLKDTKKTLHHTYLALKDTANYVYMLQYLAETYKIDKDTARYTQTLDEGFHKFKKEPYFFTRLVEYYARNGKPEKALEYTNEAMKEDSTNQLIRFTKSTIFLNTGKYKECIGICDSLLAEKDTLSDVYLNAGLAYFNMAVELDKNTQRYRKNKELILQYYEKAMPYLQKYKALAPEQKEKWILPLYTIYLNLNKGKEFDEIDKLMNR